MVNTKCHELIAGGGHGPILRKLPREGRMFVTDIVRTRLPAASLAGRLLRDTKRAAIIHMAGARRISVRMAAGIRAE